MLIRAWVAFGTTHAAPSDLMNHRQNSQREARIPATLLALSIGLWAVSANAQSATNGSFGDKQIRLGTGQLPSDVDLVGKFPVTGDWTLSTNDGFVSVGMFAASLTGPTGDTNDISFWLWGQLLPETQILLQTSSRVQVGSSNQTALRRALTTNLINSLNRVIAGDLIYTKERFSSRVLEPDTKQLLALKPHGNALAHLNRMLLEDSSPFISKSTRVILDPAMPRFAVVDFRSRHVVFYKNDGSELCNVTVSPPPPQRWLEPLPGEHPPAQLRFQFVYQGSNRGPLIWIGKQYGILDIERATFSWLGSN